MQYLVIALVLMLLCVFGFSCRKNVSTPSGSKPPVPVTVSSEKFLSRQDIEKRLDVIAKSPPPKNLAVGAMCYVMAPGGNRSDYVCPVCGEKTLYAIDNEADDAARQQYWQTMHSLGDLDSCRRLVREIDKLDIALDESQFCNHCSSNVKTPQLGLMVRYPDSPEPHRAWGITQTDLLMLDAAAEGKWKFKGLQDDETALKNCLPRLQELLGVTLDDAEQQ